MIDISKKDFEAQVEHVLRNANDYHKRTSEIYDAELCFIPAVTSKINARDEVAQWLMN